MQVYFDKENLLSFLDSRKDQRFRYCEETLLQHCHVFLNFPKDDLKEDSDDNERIKNWMKSCSDGFNTVSWNWDANFPQRPIKSNVANTFNSLQHSAVYLVNDENLHRLKEKQQYLVSNIGEEVEVLSHLWFTDRQYIKNVFEELDKWSKLSVYQSPCSDIIVCDQYLLSDASLLEFNLYDLLCQLCFPSASSRMNIVIFTLKKHDGRNNIDANNIISEIQK